MSAKTLRMVSGHIAGWCAIACFVLLLTFIFSFLGTIFCSVLAGMMLGAMKPHRWYSVPISLLFPVAISVMLRAMKAELPERQIDLLSLLCLGSFWLAFFLAALLVSAEQKARRAAVTGPGEPSQPAAPRETGSVAGHAPADCRMAAPIKAVSTESADGLTLARLQGRWWWKPANGNREVHEKVLEIKDHDLVLKEVDGAGQVCWAAWGTVRLDGAGARQLLVVESPPLAVARPQ
jgi:hypothetical protein